MPGTLRWRADRGEWMVDIYVGGRRYRRFVGANKALADAALRAWQDDRVRVANRLPAWIASIAPPLGEYSVEYLEGLRTAGRAARTIALRERHVAAIVAELGDTPLNLIRRPQFQGFVRAQLASGLSPSTVHVSAGILRHMLRTAAAAELIPPPENLGPLPPMRRRERFLDAREVERLLRAVAGQRDLELLVRLTLWSGLRISEALGLRWRDIDRKAAVIRIARAKGGQPATAPLHPTLAARLVPPAGAGPGAFVIPRRQKDRELARASLGQRLVRAAARAGIPGVHHHVLRHTYESHLGMTGADPGTLSGTGA
jgi:integrase/recombinase XerC